MVQHMEINTCKKIMHAPHKRNNLDDFKNTIIVL